MTSPLRMFPRGDKPTKPEDLLDGAGRNGARSISAWKEATALLREHRGYVLIGIVLTLVSRVAGLVLPASSKYFIDNVLVHGHREDLLKLAAVVVSATIVQAGAGYALAIVLGVVAQRAVTDMRRKLQAHVLRLPVARFDATQTGALISRIMGDPDGIRNLLGSGFVQLLGALVTAGASLCVLFWVDWRITTVMLVFLCAIGGGVAYAFSKLRPVNRERSVEFARITGRLGESLGGVRIVKAYVAERREDLIFTKGVHRLLRMTITTVTGWSAVGALTALVVGGIGATLILMGGHAVMDGSLTLGDLAMYALFTGLVAAPLIQVAQIGTQISDALAGLERARELLNEDTEDTRDSGTQRAARFTGAVSFENVGFHYSADAPVLRSISFDAAAGSTTAIVGASGSGKSTLLGLLAAFHRPTSGCITVDGTDITRFDLRQYRAQIGLVLQDTFLFDGTILENIRFSRPDVAMETVLHVARLSHCEEFILRLPNGYDTIVGERGVKLSGGQRQRVAIARALLVDPSILLLDEATSSLDSESEALIQQGLDALRKARTTFVIAHRLSTILSADQIIVLEAGQIVERGTHDVLIANGGRYAHLYEQQQRSSRNRFVNVGEELPVQV